MKRDTQMKVGLAVLAVAAIFAASMGSVYVPFGAAVQVVAAGLPGGVLWLMPKKNKSEF